MKRYTGILKKHGTGYAKRPDFYTYRIVQIGSKKLKNVLADEELSDHLSFAIGKETTLWVRRQLFYWNLLHGIQTSEQCDAIPFFVFVKMMFVYIVLTAVACGLAFGFTMSVIEGESLGPIFPIISVPLALYCLRGTIGHILAHIKVKVACLKFSRQEKGFYPISGIETKTTSTAPQRDTDPYEKEPIKKADKKKNRLFKVAAVGVTLTAGTWVFLNQDKLFRERIQIAATEYGSQLRLDCMPGPCYALNRFYPDMDIATPVVKKASETARDAFRKDTIKPGTRLFPIKDQEILSYRHPNGASAFLRIPAPCKSGLSSKKCIALVPSRSVVGKKEYDLFKKSLKRSTPK